MENNIKVATLYQPYATLLAHKIKINETRPNATTFRGTYLIHAAKLIPAWCKDVCCLEPFKSELAKLGYASYKDLPTGAIVGSFEVEDVAYSHGGCIKRLGEKFKWLEDYSNEQPLDYAFGDFSAGRCIWLGKNHVAFKTPIPYTNGQGYYRNFDVNKLQNLEGADYQWLCQQFPQLREQ